MPPARDVAIIGAGPVGLFAVFECGMLDMRCQCSTRCRRPGGQCAALYPEKPIYDIPGYPRIDAAELVDRLREQAAPFAPGLHLGQPSTAWRASARRVGRLETSAGERSRRARGDRSPPASARSGRTGRRSPASPNSRSKSVFYLVQAARGFPRQARRHRRRRRLGGRLGAVARPTSPSGSSSSIAAPSSAPRRNRRRSCSSWPRRASIELVDPVSAARAGGQPAGSSRRSSSPISTAARGASRRTACCRSSGWRLNLGPIARWGLELDRNQIRVDPATCATSRAGHLRDRRHRRLSRQAQADPVGLRRGGAGGARDHPLVHPGEALHFEYSTTKGVPGR